MATEVGYHACSFTANKSNCRGSSRSELSRRCPFCATGKAEKSTPGAALALRQGQHHSTCKLGVCWCRIVRRLFSFLVVLSALVAFLPGASLASQNAAPALRCAFLRWRVLFFIAACRTLTRPGHHCRSAMRAGACPHRGAHSKSALRMRPFYPPPDRWSVKTAGRPRRPIPTEI